jgi:hypothetical protein
MIVKPLTARFAVLREDSGSDNHPNQETAMSEQPRKNMRGEDREWHKRKVFVEPSWPVTIVFVLAVLAFVFGTLWVVHKFWWN